MTYKKQLKALGDELEVDFGALMMQCDEMQKAIDELQKENKMLTEMIERLGLRLRNLESMEHHI